MVCVVFEDFYVGFVNVVDLVSDIDSLWLELFDLKVEFLFEVLLDDVVCVEVVVLLVEGVQQVMQVSVGYSYCCIYFVILIGFLVGYEWMDCSILIGVFVGIGDGMECDYDYDSCIF